ncbi:PAS domain S-box protein [Pontiella agarivorans]|uniref:histidine kinase n=1 Tax=Pontiella agarivorans TaxID=3038953 RepID=A0ABU5MUR0_9BACT|nr:PAS domain S-box protein [Pontiella agarivorans]MDZ8117953.1 PAS domain S-box protein [Pontiella agarivorans]
MVRGFKLGLGVLLLGALSVMAEDAARAVRVGVFDMEPLNFVDEEGGAQGFNPDLLREIARVRGRWVPEFVPVTWAEGLAKLQREELDLMMCVTYTVERTEVMDFTETPVLEVWSQVCVAEESDVESVLDLHGLHVGIMKEGIHGKNFIQLAVAFGIDYTCTAYDSHREIFEALEAGEIDAGVVPNHYGLRFGRRYHVVGTPIQFSPAPVHFAAKRGRHADVLADIDAVLGPWKENRGSYYFRQFDYWFGAEHPWRVTVPFWVKALFGVTVFSTVLFLVLSWWLRREVKLRTERLSSSEERYRMLVENQSDLVVKVDADGTFLYVSPSYCEVFEKREEDLLGSTFLPLVHEEDRASTEMEFVKVFEPPHTAYMEQRAMTKSGWRWLSWQDTAILDESGKVQAIIGVGRDITERKEAELALKRTNERLQLATQAGKVGIWEYEFETDNLIWDDQMFEIFGVARETFNGKFHSWERSVHPDDVEKIQEEFRLAVEEHETFEAEFRIVTERLQVRHVRGLAQVEYDKEGKPRRVVGMNWDVTPYRQMVAALTASEQDYRNLFENMTTGFVLFEVVNSASGIPIDFRFSQLNESARKMAKRDRMELIGRSLKEVFQPLEEYWDSVLAKVAMTGTASSYENRMEAIGRYISVWIFVPKPGYLGVVVTDVTARRIAEEAVRQAQRQLQHIFDNTNDVIFTTDAEGSFTYINSAAEEVTGFPIGELIGKNLLDLAVPECRDEIAARLQWRGEGHTESGSFYFEMEHRDGSHLVLEIVTTVIPDAEGRLKEIHGIARDVTERIRTERELEESRLFQRRIIDTIPARVFWKDRNCIYMGCNSAFALDAGFECPDDLVGRSDFEMGWSETEADAYRRDDNEVMELELERINYEEPQTRPDGSKYWLSTSKVPIRDVDGRVIGVLGAYQDITVRKTLEEERARLTTAINQSAEAIVIMDLKGFIQYVNPAFETVTGFTPAEAVGRNLAIIKSGRHDDLFYSNIWKTIESGTSWNGRIVNRHKDGSLYTVESAISPVKDPTGTIEHYVVAIRDVTNQIELEQHVRQAQKMDAVGRLAGGVAHDFNNILQSILGFSGILMGELEEGSAPYEDVAEIRTAARRAGDLTRQLLTLSRKHNVEYSVLNLNHVILQNEKMMRRLIGEQIEFVFDLAEELKPVRADQSQIEQIILNLFINARDAMPEGGRLTVRTYNGSPWMEEVSEPEHGLICLQVSDSGHGIREDVRQHLFEPFYTTKQVGEGTGLGLSVVYGIVQRHSGRIEVESRVGEGAVFSVYLPVCAEQEGLAEEEDGMPVDERSLEGHGERILVMEDDTVVRDLTCRMLKDAGYDVESAADVAEAGRAMTEGCFDLLIADMVLPDGSGLELAQTFRKSDEHLAVLICSGYSHDSATHDVIKKNHFRYLEKPVGSMLLLQTVREMLDEASAV